METNYKRQYRQIDDTTKQKISQALRGRTKSATHAQSISDGLKNYWKQVPNKPNNNKNLLSTNE
jgi:cytochrome c551/c552